MNIHLCVCTGEAPRSRRTAGHNLIRTDTNNKTSLAYAGINVEFGGFGNYCFLLAWFKTHFVIWKSHYS